MAVATYDNVQMEPPMRSRAGIICGSETLNTDNTLIQLRPSANTHTPSISLILSRAKERLSQLRQIQTPFLRLDPKSVAKTEESLTALYSRQILGTEWGSPMITSAPDGGTEVSWSKGNQEIIYREPRTSWLTAAFVKPRIGVFSMDNDSVETLQIVGRAEIISGIASLVAKMN